MSIGKRISIITGSLPEIWWTQKVTWKNFLGDVSEVECGGETLEIAVERAFIKAQAFGWTPKKWWQFWRWTDTPDLRKKSQ